MFRAVRSLIVAAALSVASVPTPAQADGPWSRSQVRQWVIEYAQVDGVNQQLLLGVASCEHHFSSDNPFQFQAGGIWYSWANPYRAINRISDTEANVAAAAYLFAHGYGPGNWTTYGRDCRGPDGF